MRWGTWHEEFDSRTGCLAIQTGLWLGRVGSQQQCFSGTAESTISEMFFDAFCIPSAKCQGVMGVRCLLRPRVWFFVHLARNTQFSHFALPHKLVYIKVLQASFFRNLLFLMVRLWETSLNFLWITSIGELHGVSIFTWILVGFCLRIRAGNLAVESRVGFCMFPLRIHEWNAMK